MSGPSWSDILGHDGGLAERLTSAWRSLLGRSNDTPESTTDATDAQQEADTDEERAPSVDVSDGSGGFQWPPRPAAFGEAPTPPEGAGTIEVTVWHAGNAAAGEVARDYLRAAFAEAWGEQFHVAADVRLAPEEARTRETFTGFIFDHAEGPAKDVNILVNNRGKFYGGGPTAVAGGLDEIESLAGKAPRVRGSSDAHYHVNMVLHEAGHCLGFLHEHGREVQGPYSTGRHATPMATSYADAQHWDHRFSRACRDRGPEVKTLG